MRHCIFITGPHGSWKTTIAKYIANYFSLPLLSVGDSLRNLAQTDEDVNYCLSHGLPVSAEAIERATAHVIDWFSNDTFVREGTILSQEQLDWLNIFAMKRNITLSVVFLTTSESTVRKRLLWRWRHDDSDNIIEKRIINSFWESYIFHKQLDYVSSIIYIDTEQSLDNVRSDAKLFVENVLFN